METAVVTVAQGQLRGKKTVGATGKQYYSFQGIPYAKPPVGPLRFKAPEPAEPWTGVRDALAEGSIAPQKDVLYTNKYLGDEDCLFLNVYTPKLPESKAGTLLPVMTFIHGGGFYFGSGNTDFYDADFLVTGEVVLVTINYRIGALGFLSTGDSVIPGNNGLKDQVQALRWIQQNIAKFGGDPNNVTIFGESAGAGSTHYHLLSPMSKGLFHKAIVHSGSALGSWAFADASTARNKAFRFGAALGCNTNSSKELLNFLSKVPARELVEGMDKTLTMEEKHPLQFFFQPTEEISDCAGEKFLQENPKNLVSAGKFHDVPVVIGLTSQEGMFVLKDVKQNMGWYETLNNNFECVLPRDLNLKKGTDKAKQLAEKVKKFYFGDKQISAETMEQISEYFSDIWFVSAVISTVKKQVMKSSNPMYVYLFSYEGNMGFLPHWLGDAKLRGVGHGDELCYLFQTSFNKNKKLDPEGDDMKTINRVVKMWTNFARTGNPTPEADPLLQGITWPPATVSEPTKHLNIDSTLAVGHHIFPERVAFWEKIYKAAQ